MTTGFDLLIPRKTKAVLPEILDTLPDFFKIYLQYYHQSVEEFPFRTHKRFVPKENRTSQLGWISQEGGLLTIEGDCVVWMDTMEEISERLSNASDGWLEDGFLFIGCTIANHILLGYRAEETRDKIYLQERAGNDDYIEVGENIFSFFQKIYLKHNEEGLRENSGIDLKDLYRNFHEDFWRVREEGDATQLIEQKNQEIAAAKAEKDQYYYRLKKLARADKEAGKPLSDISERYGFSLAELGEAHF